MGRRSALSALFAILACLLTVMTVAADAHPWRPRQARGFRPNHMATARIDAHEWPREPNSPSDLDRARFASALHEICGWMPPSRPGRYAEWIARDAAEFGEDPFLIGGLIYHQTHCRPDAEAGEGIGLSLIQHRMYFGELRRKRHRYQVREGGNWVTRERPLERFPFSGPQLGRSEPNLYFTAALLRGWREQHPSVDEAFDQVPHRHHVSHFIWGDRVRSDRDEDRILTARRRLLQYYGALPERAPIAYRGVSLGSPLDGAPRVVSSGLGSARDGGDRAHRGIDVESVFGEPVRAVADGRVSFAGADLPGHRNHQQMSPEEVQAVPRDAFGAGGRYVCISHAPSDGGPLRSCYMHLETLAVSWGQQVSRGTLVGTVGRTGMQRSAPHLHLELHGPEGVLDPLTILAGHIIGRPTEL